LKSITATQKNEPSQLERDEVARRFLRSELGLGLTGSGVILERDDVLTNFESLLRVQERVWKSKSQMIHTIMGKEYYEVKSNQAHKGSREMETIMRKYADSVAGLPSWSYWMEKDWESRHVSKSDVELNGLIKTAYIYSESNTAPRDIPQERFEQLRPHVMKVFEVLNEAYKHADLPTIEEFDTWKAKFNSNRNSGHPYYMPISMERMEAVDYPNTRDWLYKLATSVTREQLEEIASMDPGSVKGMNDRVYTMFFRATDRLIHGIRLLWKIPGAYATACMDPLKGGSPIAWEPLDLMADEFANALADATAVGADDLKKFDRSIAPQWFDLIYDCFLESDFLQSHNHFRNIIGALIYECSKPSKLRVSPTHTFTMSNGLWSGHPLTQFLGSIIHMVLYYWWEEKYHMKPTLRKVLSDDGIHIHNNMEPHELEDLLMGPCSEDLKSLGMEMHPDKTMVSDPNDRTYMGQFEGTSIEMIDMPFFLKRNFQPQAQVSHGNPIGLYKSLLQTERDATDAAIFASVEPFLKGYDNLTLGGGPPKRLYDVARVVDVISSGGRGNPLVDDYIAYVQTTWPGFSDSGVNYLTEKIDAKWRKTTTAYAGGTLDSGLARDWAVEALISEPGEYKLWDEVVFRNR